MNTRPASANLVGENLAIFFVVVFSDWAFANLSLDKTLEISYEMKQKKIQKIKRKINTFEKYDY